MVIDTFIAVSSSGKYDKLNPEFSGANNDNQHLTDEENDEVNGELLTCFYKGGKIKEYEMSDEFYSPEERKELEKSSPVVASFKDAFIYEFDTDGTGVVLLWRTREINVNDKKVDNSTFKDYVSVYKR